MNKTLAAFLVALGIIAACLGFYMTFMESDDFYDETTATITKIDVINNGLSAGDTNTIEYEYHVYVHYAYNGQEYDAETDYYEPDFEVGQEIPIFVSKTDPTDIKGDSKGFGIYVLVIGVLAAAVGGFFLYRSAKQE